MRLGRLNPQQNPRLEASGSVTGVVNRERLPQSLWATSVSRFAHHPNVDGIWRFLVMVEIVESWFDGSCEPVNPLGHASYGCLVKKNGITVFEKSGYVGVGEGMSNNVAEYSGIIAVMEFLLSENLSQGTIYGDSKLVVQQMNRKWRAKGGMYLPYFKQAIALRVKLPDVQIKWIPRALNAEADYLSRRASYGAPRAEGRNRELVRLIKQQRSEIKRERWKIERDDLWNRFDHAVRGE